MSEPSPRRDQTELRDLLAQRPLLLGCAVDSASPAVAEMAGMAGFDFVWADLEHMNVSCTAAEAVCRGAKAGGALPVLRVAGHERPHILGALEAGATAVVVPMIDSPEQAAQVVEYGKYAPLGNRGFHGATRGLSYGLRDPLSNLQHANDSTHLIVQIETARAASLCREIVSVPGLSGGLVGPADLSISLGKPFAFDDPLVIDVFRTAIRTIREAGLIACTVTRHTGLIQAAMEEGVQLLVCAGEFAALRQSFASSLAQVRELFEAAAPWLSGSKQ